MNKSVRKYKPESARELFHTIIDKLEDEDMYEFLMETIEHLNYLDEDDHFGTEGWEILFLGADFDVSTYANQWGLGSDKFINTKAGTRETVFRSMANNTSLYASGAATMSFGDDLKAFADKEQEPGG